MAPQHSGFIHEYPLMRVDNFTAHLPRLPSTLPRDSYKDLPADATHFVHPHVLLLSHCHTDHLAGLLSAAKHGAPIYCSEVTKRLLLALERKEDRLRYDNGIEPRRVHPYAKLQKSQRQSAAMARHVSGSGASTSSQGWDLLVALPFDEPVEIEYSAMMQIRLTLLSANHMPGSTIFLIQGPRGSILHTGDVRTEAGFVEKLLTQTHLGTLSVQLSPTIDDASSQCQQAATTVTVRSPSVTTAQRTPDLGSPSPRPDEAGSASLGHLYLDTERLLDCNEPPTKTAATVDVMQLLRLLSKTQRVHINCWTSGYEAFLLAVTKAFRQEIGKIHVDRYKYELYKIMALDSEHHGIDAIVSTDRTQCGRFCACDNAQCMEGAIQIKPEEGMSAVAWQEIKLRLRKQLRSAALGKGELPSSIPVPLQRHSPLRELYRTIALLRPRRVTANTAAASARFVLARISERLRLTVMGDEDTWQKSCSLVPRENEERQWQILESAWQEAGTTGQQDASVGTVVTDASFFERVGRFKRLLYGLRNDLPQRLRMEMLDAEALMVDTDDYQQVPALRAKEVDTSISKTYDVAQTSPEAQIWTAPGKYATANASPFRTQAMASTSAIRSADPPPVTRETNASHARIMQQVPAPGQAILTVELASRYLAYTAMYLGWRIRNPSRYSQDVAWRALRKMRPELARKTEEALLKELGWPIPPWSSNEGDTTTSTNGLTAVNSMKIADTTALSEPAPAPSVPIVDTPAQSSAAQLEQRLSVEAESQGQLFAKARVGPVPDCGRPDISTGSVATASKAMMEIIDANTSSEEDATATTDLLFVAEQCLRKSRPLLEALVQGPLLFDAILREWGEAEHAEISFTEPALAGDTGSKPMIDMQKRRTAQLTLIGVAARSVRARHLLGWDVCDFDRAHDVLRRVCLYHTATSGLACTKASSPSKRKALVEALASTSDNVTDNTGCNQASPVCTVPLGWPGRTLAVLQYLSTKSSSSQNLQQLPTQQASIDKSGDAALTAKRRRVVQA